MQIESRIYLASKSPRRRELLTQIGVRFDLMLFRAAPREDAATDETPLPGEAPEAYARRVAGAKARHAAELIALRRLAVRPVLAADTTLDVDGDIVGKPADETDAAAILHRLSGRSHRVITAVALAHANVVECLASVSEVRFRQLDSEEIRRYAISGEPMDKAGAYGIQGRAAMFIEEIRGSHSGIVGLPLCETALLLRRAGYPI
ncbi:MAG: septum formation protein Maf [Rhodocyclales bacterium GWA2_65_20]|nr:MAG: septum formation protein Maf [Rhodocyclales bacterium GWA2_65_20]